MYHHHCFKFYTFNLQSKPFSSKQLRHQKRSLRDLALNQVYCQTKITCSRWYWMNSLSLLQRCQFILLEHHLISAERLETQATGAIRKTARYNHQLKRLSSKQILNWKITVITFRFIWMKNQESWINLMGGRQLKSSHTW